MRIPALLLAACTFAASATAQDTLAPPAPPATTPAASETKATEVSTKLEVGDPEPRKAQAAFMVYGDNTFSSDLDDGDGDVSVWRAGASLSMSFPVGPKSDIGASMRAERWGFDFQDAAEFDPSGGAPWDDVTDLAFLVSFQHQCTEKWSAGFGLGGEAAYADGADFSDSLMGGGFVSASYKFSETFTAGLGVSVRSRLEDDVLVVPFLMLDWRIADKWRLRTSPGVSRRLLGLAYTPCEEFTITMGGGYELLDFRLDDDGPAPKGVGRYERIPVGVDVAWNISKQFSVSLYGGAQVWQRYELDDQDGNDIADSDADIAPFLGAAVEWKF